MSVIKIEKLTFSYPSGGDTVFDGVNLNIDTEWKLGLIGRNGRGKTTLLKLLCGKYEYGGRISSPVAFRYFPYEISDRARITVDVLASACPEAEEWQFVRELSLLDADVSILYRPFGTLSNGEQTKALLAALFLNNGNYPLIDEPTNHLDADARRAVSEYLSGKQGFILVSHDRAVLDGCVDHILSINKSDIELQTGNFTSYMTNFEQRQQLEREQSRRLQTDIKRLRESALRTSAWADKVEASKIGAGDKGYVGHKSAKMMKRAKVTEARYQREIEQKSRLLKNAEYADELKLAYEPYRSERLALFSSVAPVHDGKEVCTPTTFEITRGKRIALNGKNGCGKSSVLKLLAEAEPQFSGRLYVAPNVKISYVPQDVSHIKGSIAEYAKSSGADASLYFTILKKLGFKRSEFENDLSELSEGQKKKIVMAKSLCEKANLYVWDEPLNYIDIYTRLQIEELIAQADPTMIFVEHDCAFRNAVATDVVNL